MDIYRQNKSNEDNDGAEQVINITHTVESYQPVDVSSMLNSASPSDSMLYRGFDEEDEKAGLDEPPADYEVEEDVASDESTEDIKVNNHGGIPACNFKQMIQDIARQQENLFVDCLIATSNA